MPNSSEVYTKEFIQQVEVDLLYAMKRLGVERNNEIGMYAPLAKRYPIRYGNEIPKYIHDMLTEHNTCACTDGKAIYIDIINAIKMFKGISNEVDHYEYTSNFCTLITHEYTHILMMHQRKGIEFVHKYGEENYRIFSLACEIEANRAYRIDSTSQIYKIGVTEDTFPKCKYVYGLMNIYQILCEEYKDEINNSNDSEPNQNEQGEEGEEGEEDESEAKRSKISKAVEKHEMDMIASLEQIKRDLDNMSQEELDKLTEPNPNSLGKPDEHIVRTYEGKTDVIEAIEKLYNENIDIEMNRIMLKLSNIIKGTDGKNIKRKISTYSRQSRKSNQDGLIMKGKKNAKIIAPKVLVAMDSSGSMSSTSVKNVAEAIGTIAKKLGKTKGSYICMHESHVSNVHKLSEYEQTLSKYRPDGCNDFDKVLKLAIELNVEIVINIGDGLCELMSKEMMQEAVKKNIKWIDVIVSKDAQDNKQTVIKSIGRNEIERFCGISFTSDEMTEDKLLDKEIIGSKYIGRRII